jgi:hypothetical protein
LEEIQPNIVLAHTGKWVSREGKRFSKATQPNRTRFEWTKVLWHRVHPNRVWAPLVV